MNIKPTDSINGAAAYKSQSVQAKKPGAPPSTRYLRPDEFISSNHSADKSADTRAQEVSDARKERVEELKKLVQSGSYRVDSYDLAARIMETAYKGVL